MDINPGVHEYAATQCVGDCYGVRASIDYSQFTDPDVEMVIETWLSVDGGKTWVFGGGCVERGISGPMVDIFGNPQTVGVMTSLVKVNSYDAAGKFIRIEPSWKGPLLKLVLRVGGGTAKTAVAVEPISVITQPVSVPDLHHSIALGVHASIGGAGVGTVAVTTAGIDTNTGSLMVLGNSYFNGVNAFSSNSDSNSNSWAAQSLAEVNATNVQGQERYNPSITGGVGNTFTLTMAGNTSFPTVAATEITGAHASPFDTSQHNEQVNSSSTSRTSNATGTLAQADELLLGTGCIGQATGSGSCSAPWTQVESVPNDGNHQGIFTGYQIVSATTGQAFDWTTSAGTLSTASWITTFKAAAAGATVKTLAAMGVG